MDESDPRPSIHGKDEDRLAELGYKQELTRNWSLMHNFGVSFSIIVRLEPYLFLTNPSHCTVVSTVRQKGAKQDGSFCKIK